jgi:hypothetical protein
VRSTCDARRAADFLFVITGFDARQRFKRQTDRRRCVCTPTLPDSLVDKDALNGLWLRRWHARCLSHHGFHIKRRILKESEKTSDGNEPRLSRRSPRNSSVGWL